MIRNYFVTTLRYLVRQKGFTIINIAGLAIGMAIAILIYIWVQHELSYDKFNTNSDRIFRLVQTQHYSSGPLTTVCMPGPIAEDIRNEIPEIQNSFTYYFVTMTVNHEENIYTEEVCLADPQLFEMFDFDFQKGNPKLVFDDMKSIVISDKMAEKLFEGEDPIGKVISLNNEMEFRVSGIISETRKNSSFRFDLCIPFENIEEMGFTINRYGWNTYYVYTQLANNTNYQDVNSKINKYLEIKSREQNEADGEENYESNIDLFLFPLEKIHLYSYRAESTGGIQFVYIFSAIALFIIFIACINFMNLATARSAKRAKEISIRKSIGADRPQLIRQFLGESILISISSMLLAIVLVFILLPYFNLLIEKELTFPHQSFGFWLLIVSVSLLIGILAGSYPAFYLSAFNPVKTLRNGRSSGRGNFHFRRTLVVFQFVLSIGLIIGTLVVNRQLNYLINNKLGMDINQVMLLSLRGESPGKFENIKNDLLKIPDVLGVSRASSIPFYIGSNSGGIEWEGKDSEDDIIVGFTFTDVDYIETMGMKLVDGRYFSSEIQSDTAAVIINETAAKAFSLDSPVGKWLTWGGDDRYKIIGVVRDFHHLPMQMGIDPLTIYYDPDDCRQVLVNLSENNIDETKEKIQAVWESNINGFPFEPRFLKDIYENTYSDEARLIQIIGYFAILAILISCLGLFALSTYMAEQRTKEIGIRKVMGATTGSIVSLMSKEFIIWVIVANIIASPIAWYALKAWLDGYVYHTRISADIFIIALVISLLIAMITVTYQSVRSALKKPVESIKYE